MDTDQVIFYKNPLEASEEQIENDPAELANQESAPSTANNGIPTVNTSIWYWLNDQYVGKSPMELDISESASEAEDDIGDDNIKPQQPNSYKVKSLTSTQC